MEQETLAHQKAIDGISELATALDHPRAVGLGRDPGDVDTARRELDHKQHDVPRQTRRGPHFHREEVSTAVSTDILHFPARVVGTAAERLTSADGPPCPRGVERRERTADDHPP